MRVRRFYRPGALYTVPTESLREAARKMRRGAVSCLPVIHDGAVVGVVAERDFVDAVANAAQPAAALVSGYMNDGSVTVTLDDDSSTAELKMLAVGCRHLPVVDHGALVGMVSARDLFLLKARTQPPGEPELVSAAAGRQAEWPEEPPPDVDSES